MGSRAGQALACNSIACACARSSSLCGKQRQVVAAIRELSQQTPGSPQSGCHMLTCRAYTPVQLLVGHGADAQGEGRHTVDLAQPCMCTGGWGWGQQLLP